MRVPFIPYVQGLNDYTDGDGRKYGLAFHNTSNDASDTGEALYATRRTDGIGSHFYGDADSFTQSIDTADRVGHAGSREGNENAICFELTGANGWSRAQWLANIAWPLLGRVAAAVIRHHWPDGSFQVRRASVAEMQANPKIKACYGHDDMRRAWGGTTHTDPGPNFPWDRLFAVINAALNPEDEMKLFIVKGTKPVYLYDGWGRRHVPDGATLIRVQKALGLGDPTVLDTQADLDLIAPAPRACPGGGTLSPEEIDKMVRDAINETSLTVPDADASAVGTTG